jgi:hypothetical protein
MGKVTKDIKGEPVSLIVKTDNQKFHLGTLNSKTIPHVSYCLVFDKEFELSMTGNMGKSPLLELQWHLSCFHI